MRVKCHKLGNVSNAVFFWEETYQEQDKFGNVKEAKRKAFKTCAVDEEFDVPDEAGHLLLATYKENLRVVHYGDETPTKKSTSSPRTAMIKDAINKEA